MVVPIVDIVSSILFYNVSSLPLSISLSSIFLSSLVLSIIIIYTIVTCLTINDRCSTMPGSSYRSALTPCPPLSSPFVTTSFPNHIAPFFIPSWPRHIPSFTIHVHSTFLLLRHNFTSFKSPLRHYLYFIIHPRSCTRAGLFASRPPLDHVSAGQIPITNHTLHPRHLQSCPPQAAP